MDGFDVQCGQCGAHFQMDPAGSVQDAACSECGGNRFFRSQPSPTQSDGALRDQVDMSVGGKDQGGNSLGQGAIVGNDGERPAGKRDNYMHSRRINAENSWSVCPQCGEEHRDVMEPMSGLSETPSRLGMPVRTCDICAGHRPAMVEVPDTPPPGHPLDWGGHTASVYEDIGQMAHGQPLHIQHILQDILGHEGPNAAIRYLDTLQQAPQVDPGPGNPYWDSQNADPLANYVLGKTSHTVSERVMELNTTPYAPLWDESYVPKTAGIAAPLLEGAGSMALRSLPFALPTLMKGALGGGPQGGQQAGGMAPEQPDPAPTMQQLGSVDIPWLLTADLDTPSSVKSVDGQEDDPQKQDQKEFNDGDKSPSNLQNPNNDDSGNMGEDQVRQDAGFAPDSPGIERAMMILPLLLHYFDSEESGQNDPLIKGLHDALEHEQPGYLNNEHPDGQQHVMMILQNHGNGHTAGVNAFPGGLPATPQPGSGTQAPGAGTCPTCGGTLAGDGSCPQCGSTPHPQGGMQMPTGQGMGGPSGSASFPPGMMMHGNTVGPQTNEQKAAVAQLLIQQGRIEEIPNLELHPEQYAKELAEIQGNPNTAPLVDPSQAPQPPQPMMDPQGAMPVTDPTQMGGGGGQPMQPMARVAAPGIPLMDGSDPTPYWHGYDPGMPTYDNPFQRTACPRCHQPGMNMQGRCATCGYQIGDEDGFSQGGLGLQTPNPGGPFAGEVPHPDDPPNLPLPGGNPTEWGPRHWGKTADANNSVPRCPRCNTATTTFADSIDGNDKPRGFCHSCQRHFPLKESMVILADLPNPVLDNAADRTAINPEPTSVETTLTFHDSNGNPLQPGGVYSLYRPGFQIPEEVKVVGTPKPDQIDLKLVGQSAGVVVPGSEDAPDYSVTSHDMQLQKLRFVPVDEDKQEPPMGGMPGLEQIPQSEPTTDEIGNSYPNPGTVSSVLMSSDEEAEMEADICHKCGATDIHHTASSPTRQMHECWRCGAVWETQDVYEGRESSTDLSWLYSDSYGDDFHTEMERARAMRAAGSGSRNIGDIAAKDPRLQAIRDRLEGNHRERERLAGRHFTPAEQRELVNERGVARNADMLDLAGTHYELRDAHTGNPHNAPEGHLIFGL